MLSYIFKRILSLIPVLFVVSGVVFLVVYMIPGGPATALLGMEASPEQIAEMNAQLGFDRPFLVQYGEWFVNILHGDWGDSYFLQQSVAEAIGEYFTPTLSLAILAQIFALVLSSVGNTCCISQGNRCGCDGSIHILVRNGHTQLFAEYVSYALF